MKGRIETYTDKAEDLGGDPVPDTERVETQDRGSDHVTCSSYSCSRTTAYLTLYRTPSSLPFRPVGTTGPSSPVQPCEGTPSSPRCLTTGTGTSSLSLDRATPCCYHEGRSPPTPYSCPPRSLTGQIRSTRVTRGRSVVVVVETPKQLNISDGRPPSDKKVLVENRPTCYLHSPVGPSTLYRTVLGPSPPLRGCDEDRSTG